MINRFVSQLFSNINKKKIRYAILRNYESCLINQKIGIILI